MKRLASVLLLSGLVLSGCATESPCEQAAAYLDSCGADVADDFAERCDDRSAELTMSLSCETILEDGKGDGKGDGWLGYLEKGATCWLNAECSGVLVCRPATPDSGFLGTEDEFCAALGTYGDTCDGDNDCKEPLRCIGDALLGGTNGFCRKPI